MEITIFEGELFEENTYVLTFNNGDQIVIDPGCDLINKITKDKVVGIFLTHAHVDHMLYAERLAQECKTKIYVHKLDEPLFDDDDLCLFSEYGNAREKHECTVFDDEDKFIFDKTQMSIIHTPGHTPGSVCFILEDAIFTGDTLMKSSIGRCDLPGGNTESMKNTLSKLAKIDNNLIIYPGHGPVTTLRREKEYNVYLRNFI